jgi:4-hydroxybenzoate polyprenyltransferase
VESLTRQKWTPRGAVRSCAIPLAPQLCTVSTLIAETSVSTSPAPSLLASLRRLEDALHTLHLFGSAGIAAFGWAVCRLLGFPARSWVPLWFSAGLFIYNVDRLRRDPADLLNIPARTRSSDALRGVSLLLAIGAAVSLLLLPLLGADWTTLALIVVGTPVCLNYSIPIRGRRSKDIPLLKTFVAPTLVLVATFILPLTHLTHPIEPKIVVLVALWAWGLLFANMLFCDVRDIPGDLRTGVASLPARMGPVRTRQLLWVLTATTGCLALAHACMVPATRLPWLALSLISTAYLAVLTATVSRPRSERFYERWVEGILFLPALVLAVPLLGA